MQLQRAAVCVITVCSIFIAGTVRLAGQEHHHAGGAIAVSAGHLGQVHFPTSCAPGVQQTFQKGVALLHSFQYEAADQAFESVPPARLLGWLLDGDQILRDTCARFGLTSAAIEGSR